MLMEPKFSQSSSKLMQHRKHRICSSSRIKEYTWNSTMLHHLHKARSVLAMPTLRRSQHFMMTQCFSHKLQVSANLPIAGLRTGQRGARQREAGPRI